MRYAIVLIVSTFAAGCTNVEDFDALEARERKQVRDQAAPTTRDSPNFDTSRFVENAGMATVEIGYVVIRSILQGYAKAP